MIKIQHIRTKLLLLLFASALLCLGLFHTLWANKWYVLHVITETNLPIMLPVPQPDENFWTMLGTEALNYDIPDSESDTEAVEKLQSLFDRLDDYTGLYVYGRWYLPGRSVSPLYGQRTLSVLLRCRI